MVTIGFCSLGNLDDRTKTRALGRALRWARRHGKRKLTKDHGTQRLEYARRVKKMTKKSLRRYAFTGTTLYLSRDQSQLEDHTGTLDVPAALARLI